jgi:hypothetical protein
MFSIGNLLLKSLIFAKPTTNPSRPMFPEGGHELTALQRGNKADQQSLVGLEIGSASACGGKQYRKPKQVCLIFLKGVKGLLAVILCGGRHQQKILDSLRSSGLFCFTRKTNLFVFLVKQKIPC